MSKLVKKPITIPDSVGISVVGKEVVIKGSKATLRCEIMPGLELKIDGKELFVLKTDKDEKSAKQGLLFALVRNAIIGVTEGYTKQLELIGVGYKAAVNGGKLVLNVGYSHPVDFAIPEGIEVKVEKNTMIALKGYDKQKVGLFAAKVRMSRPPEPYKGKGVRYADEHVVRKQGKTGK